MNNYIYFEEWKPLTIYNLREGYSISNYGRLFDHTRGVFMNINYTQDGYQQITLSCKDGSKKNIRINRAVLMTFNPVDNMDKLEANHKDCVRDNNFIFNLEWMTKSENNKYCYTTMRRNNIGENNPNSKLKESDVIKIYNLKNQNYTSTQILNELGFEVNNSNRAMINRVIRGETWSHLYNVYMKKY